MASNTKRAPRKKSSAPKSTAKKAAAPKTKSVSSAKAVKRPAPKKKASPAKKPAIKSRPPVKAVAKSEPAKTKPEAGKAFEKKINEMAEKNAALQKQETKTGKGVKFSIAAIIIVILAAIAYLLFPGKKTTNIEEQKAPEAPAAPSPETKTPPVQKETAPPPENANIYKVKYKDVLNEISKQVYGDSKDWKMIYEANKDKIKNPNLIYPGQELVIPKK